MWIKCNPNPLGKQTGDCVIRAISVATNQSWRQTYRDLCSLGERQADLPNSNAVWGMYLRDKGGKQFLLPESCPACITVSAFCERDPNGVYVIGTGDHEFTGNFHRGRMSVFVREAVSGGNDTTREV